MENEKYYCKKDKHPNPELMRVENIELLEKAIECPKICCAFCSRRFNCEWTCWNVEQAIKKGSTVLECECQCTLQDKVFGRVFDERNEDTTQ